MCDPRDASTLFPIFHNIMFKYIQIKTILKLSKIYFKIRELQQSSSICKHSGIISLNVTFENVHKTLSIEPLKTSTSRLPKSQR